MLRITARKGGKRAANYYLLDDAGQKAEGIWIGKLAEEMGLTGTVDHAKFAALCDNIDFRTDKRLTARDDGPEKRTALLDLTFIEPKSFTVLRHMSGDDRLEAIRREALFEVAGLVERDMRVQWRSGKDRGIEVTGNMAAAAWFHDTARPAKEDGRPDCYGHCHLTIVNATKRDDRIQSLDFQFFNNDYYAAVHSSILAEKTAALGYGIRRKGKYWEVDGVPNGLIRKFSRREQDTDEYKIRKIAEWTEMKEHGETLTGAQAYIVEHGFSGRSATQAGASSRGRKKHDADLPELKDYWRSRLTEAESAALATLRERAMAETISPPAAIDPSIARRTFAALNDQPAAKRKATEKKQQPYRKLAATMLRDFFGRARPDHVHEAIRKSGLKETIRRGVAYLTKPLPKPVSWDRIVDQVKAAHTRSFMQRLKVSRQQAPRPAPEVAVQVPDWPKESQGLSL